MYTRLSLEKLLFRIVYILQALFLKPKNRVLLTRVPQDLINVWKSWGCWTRLLLVLSTPTCRAATSCICRVSTAFTHSTSIPPKLFYIKSSCFFSWKQCTLMDMWVKMPLNIYMTHFLTTQELAMFQKAPLSYSDGLRLKVSQCLVCPLTAHGSYTMESLISQQGLCNITTVCPNHFCSVINETKML